MTTLLTPHPRDHVWACSDLRLMITSFFDPIDVAKVLVSGLYRGRYDGERRCLLADEYSRLATGNVCGATCIRRISISDTSSRSCCGAICITRLQRLSHQWGGDHELVSTMRNIGLLFPHQTKSLCTLPFSNLRSLSVYDERSEMYYTCFGRAFQEEASEIEMQYPASNLWPLLSYLPELTHVTWFPPTAAIAMFREADSICVEVARTYTKNVLRHVSRLAHLRVFQIASADTWLFGRGHGVLPADLSIMQECHSLRVLHIPLALVGSALQGLQRLEALHVTDSMNLQEDMRTPVAAIHRITSWLPRLRVLCLSVELMAAGHSEGGIPLTLCHSGLESLCLNSRALVIDEVLVTFLTTAPRLRDINLNAVRGGAVTIDPPWLPPQRAPASRATPKQEAPSGANITIAAHTVLRDLHSMPRALMPWIPRPVEPWTGSTTPWQYVSHLSLIGPGLIATDAPLDDRTFSLADFTQLMRLDIPPYILRHLAVYTAPRLQWLQVIAEQREEEDSLAHLSLAGDIACAGIGQVRSLRALEIRGVTLQQKAWAALVPLRRHLASLSYHPSPRTLTAQGREVAIDFIVSCTRLCHIDIRCPLYQRRASAFEPISTHPKGFSTIVEAELAHAAFHLQGASPCSDAEQLLVTSSNRVQYTYSALECDATLPASRLAPTINTCPNWDCSLRYATALVERDVI